MSASRIAIVTGAGGGIGQATAQEFARRGWTVVLVGRRESALREALKTLAPTSPTASIMAIDVTEDDAPARLADHVVREYGRLDVLVNNAGALLLKPFDEMTASDLDDIWKVNLRAPYLLTAALLPLLRRGDEPAVVNIGSAAGMLYRPGQSAYGLTKAALHYLTRSLAVELAPEVTVNAVIPGPVATAIHGEGAGGSTALDRIIATLPAGRAGTSEEIAHWVAALADAASRWMTGVLLPVDGGRIISPPDRPLAADS